MSCSVMTLTLNTLFLNIIAAQEKKDNIVLEFVDYYDKQNEDTFKIYIPDIEFIEPDMIKTFIVDEFIDQIQFGNIVRKPTNVIGNIIFNIIQNEFLSKRNFSSTYKLDEKYRNLEACKNIQINVVYISNRDYITILNRELKERYGGE